jgi:hypothetical protein
MVLKLMLFKSHIKIDFMSPKFLEKFKFFELPILKKGNFFRAQLGMFFFKKKEILHTKQGISHCFSVNNILIALCQ